MPEKIVSKTNTQNIIRYNSNIAITDNFSINRKNITSFKTNNVLPNNFINTGGGTEEEKREKKEAEEDKKRNYLLTNNK